MPRILFWIIILCLIPVALFAETAEEKEPPAKAAKKKPAREKVGSKK